jgi:hypothetical protein
MERALKNETSSREYTCADCIRPCIIAAIWVLFYVFVTADLGGRAPQAEKMATATVAAPLSATVDGSSPPESTHDSD